MTDIERPLGPWLRLYADVVDRKAHYTDRQFRSLVEVLALAVRLHGALPSRRALSARSGQSEIDFLFSEGDLEETDDGSVVVHRWRSYQPDPTGAERQARFRRNALVTLLPVTHNDVPSSSSSVSSSSPRNDAKSSVPSAEPILDALMGALGTVPTPKVMEWADRLVAEYGEDATVRALGTAAVEGPVKVISRAESALKESVIRRARSEAKRKESDLAEARQQRMAARRAEVAVIPDDPRPLAEILKGLPS